VTDVIVMRHPTLPDHQEIEVPRDAMPHYTSAGWQLVPQAELDERAARAAAAVEEALAAERSEAAAAEPGSDEAAEPADEPEQSEPEEPTERPARSRTKATPKKDEES
jgi:hypothetical protein